MNPKNILVVDDSATMRQLLLLTLKKVKGAQVVEASEGKDAADKLSRQPFDLAIVDINMPVMNGLELVTHIRNVLKLPLPIVMVTTKGEDGVRDQALERGANAYLTKPISGEALVKLIHELLPDGGTA
jgi:two-component system chemotaxis response regulator CheY